MRNLSEDKLLPLGVASIKPTFDGLAKDLINAADQALYKAKENGRNNVSAARL